MTEITAIEQVSEFPLCWPPQKPRAAQRISSKKTTWSATLANAHQKVEDEMRRIGATRYVVSMAPRHRFGSPDPGAAVWWNHPSPNGKPATLRVIACDSYDKAETNLYAIGLTLDRLRAIERYGAYSLEQAIEGARLALPPPADATLRWREIFGTPPTGVPPGEALAIVEYRYRRNARTAGPDELKRLNLAIEAARKELKS